MKPLHNQIQSYLQSVFRSLDKEILDSECQSCAKITFAITAPFIFLAIFISSAIIYFAGPRPTMYTKDIYVDGFTQSNFALCPHKGMNTELVVLIASSPENFEQRRAIRRTWGRYASRADVSIGFVLGATPENLTKSIEREENRYRDMIIGKFVDTYRNLTLKTLAMLKWMHDYCPYANWFMKADDDVYLNLPAWISLARRFNTSKTIWGQVNYGNQPSRWPSSKYFTSVNDFPGDVYPNYTNGPAYMMSIDCVEPLLRASFQAPYISLEDVFVTGVMAKNLGILRRDVTFISKSWRFDNFAVHNVGPAYQFVLWKTYRLKVKT